MSLIIKGMDMPEKCENCPCYDYIDYVCRADDCFAPFDVENPEERSEHCPLIEIRASHGRLIDADELIKKLERHRDMCGDIETQYGIDTAIRILRNIPTIIEAEANNEQ